MGTSREVAEMASSWHWEARAAGEVRMARELEAEAGRAERDAWRHRSMAEQYRHRAEDRRSAYATAGW
jgi:hypothetical protein